MQKNPRQNNIILFINSVKIRSPKICFRDCNLNNMIIGIKYFKNCRWNSSKLKNSQLLLISVFGDLIIITYYI